VASEALGLTISSNGRIIQTTDSNAKGRCLCLSRSTILLNSAHHLSQGKNLNDPSCSLAAFSEYQLCVGGLGLSFFLRDALKSATSSSSVVTNVILAFIRRSVRLIAGVQVHDDSCSDVQSHKVSSFDAKSVKIVMITTNYFSWASFEILHSE